MNYIDRDHVKFDVWGNLTASISSIKSRSRFYYKYSTYQRMGGDINIDICDLLTKDRRIPAMQWFFGRLTKYSNISHRCPYDNVIYARASNVSIDEFAYPDMMPAGRYRIDTTVFEDDQKVLFNASLYFSISDHRIDVKYSVL